MDRQHLQVYLGPLCVILRPPLLHISVRGAPSAEIFKRLGPPCLYRGERADHLTIPLIPKEEGANAGKFNIHLTYVQGSHRRHVSVATLTPEQIDAALQPVAMELLELYVSAARRVTVDELRRDGFVVVLPSDELEENAERLLSAKRTELRLNQGSFARLAQNFECYEPEVLTDLVGGDPYKSIMATTEDGASTMFVRYRPNGLGQDSEPGWFAMPADLKFGDLLEKKFFLGLGPSFFDALVVVARELQLDIDVDKIEHARACAAAASIPRSDSTS